jgi:hypothetical protein
MLGLYPARANNAFIRTRTRLQAAVFCGFLALVISPINGVVGVYYVLFESRLFSTFEEHHRVTRPFLEKPHD